MRKFYSLLLICFLVGLQAVASNKKVQPAAITTDFDSLWLTALNYKYQAKNDSCLNYLQQCYRLNSSSAALNYQLSEWYFKAGANDTAAAYLRKATQLDSKRYVYWQSLVRYYKQENQIDKAIECCEFIEKNFPEKDENLYDLYQLWVYKANDDKALSYLDKLEKRMGYNPRFSSARAELYNKMGNRKALIKCLNEMQERFPMDADVLAYKGALLLTLGKEQEAVNCMEQARRMQPDNGYVLSLLNDYYLETHQYARADTCYRQIFASQQVTFESKKAMVEQLLQSNMSGKERLSMLDSICHSMIAADPTNPEVYLLFVPIKYQAQQYEQAEDLLQTALYLDPSDSQTWVQLVALMALRTEDASVMRRLVASAIEQKSVSPVPYFLAVGIAIDEKASYQQQLDRMRTADSIAASRELSEVEKQVYAAVSSGMSSVSFAKGDTLLCLRYAQQAVDNSTEIVYKNDFAYYLALCKTRLDEAEQMAKLCIDKEPLNASYLDTYAYILMLKGDYHNALFFIQQALSYDETGNVELLEHYGDILYCMGNYDEARQYWLTAFAKKENPELLKKINKLQNEKMR